MTRVHAHVVMNLLLTEPDMALPWVEVICSKAQAEARMRAQANAGFGTVTQLSVCKQRHVQLSIVAVHRMSEVQNN